MRLISGTLTISWTVHTSLMTRNPSLASDGSQTLKICSHLLLLNDWGVICAHWLVCYFQLHWSGKPLGSLTAAGMALSSVNWLSLHVSLTHPVLLVRRLFISEFYKMPFGDPGILVCIWHLSCYSCHSRLNKYTYSDIQQYIFFFFYGVSSFRV